MSLLSWAKFLPADCFGRVALTAAVGRVTADSVACALLFAKTLAGWLACWLAKRIRLPIGNFLIVNVASDLVVHNTNLNYLPIYSDSVGVAFGLQSLISIDSIKVVNL